ncbi:MAG: homogentisate phytyltransferase, partial [Spirulinaceae cyanobacterium]
DKQYNIQTLTLLVGKRTVFNLACGIIVFCYVAIVVSAWLLLPELNRWLVSISHLGLLGLLWWRSQQVDLENKIAIARFYQFIWKLFFLEYLIFPALCLIK